MVRSFSSSKASPMRVMPKGRGVFVLLVNPVGVATAERSSRFIKLV